MKSNFLGVSALNKKKGSHQRMGREVTKPGAEPAVVQGGHRGVPGLIRVPASHVGLSHGLGEGGELGIYVGIGRLYSGTVTTAFGSL